MADQIATTALCRRTTSVLAFLCTDVPRLSPDVEVAAERVVPGIRVVAEIIERMLAAERICVAGRFWAAPLARHAAVLVAGRRCPGRVPMLEDLVRIGLDEAASVTSESWMADAAERLGLSG